MLPFSQRAGEVDKGTAGVATRYVGPSAGQRWMHKAPSELLWWWWWWWPALCVEERLQPAGRCVAKLLHNTLPFPPNQIVPAQMYLLPSQEQNKALHGISMVHFSVALKNNEQFNKKIIGNRATQQLGFGRRVKICERRPKTFQGFVDFKLFLYIFIQQRRKHLVRWKTKANLHKPHSFVCQNCVLKKETCICARQFFASLKKNWRLGFEKKVSDTKINGSTLLFIGKKARKGVSVITKRARKEPPECLGKILHRKIKTQWRPNKVRG